MNETPLVLLMGGNNGENFIVYSATHTFIHRLGFYSNHTNTK